MDSRIYGEGRINISLSSPATIDLLGKIQIDRFYTNIKIASNTRINHIMVSFTNHYNAIFVGRFPSQTKIGKDSWYFNNSLCVSLSSPQLQILFLLITQKTTTLQQVTDGKTLNLVLKMLEPFLKIQENIRISILKKKAPKLIQKRKLQTRN